MKRRSPIVGWCHHCSVLYCSRNFINRSSSLREEEHRTLLLLGLNPVTFQLIFNLPSSASRRQFLGTVIAHAYHLLTGRTITYVLFGVEIHYILMQPFICLHYIKYILYYELIYEQTNTKTMYCREVFSINWTVCLLEYSKHYTQSLLIRNGFLFLNV